MTGSIVQGRGFSTVLIKVQVCVNEWHLSLLRKSCNRVVCVLFKVCIVADFKILGTHFLRVRIKWFHLRLFSTISITNGLLK